MARVEAAKTGAVIELGHDPHVAVKEADVIYTDVWISMGREREQARRLKVLAPYQVNSRLSEGQARCDRDALFAGPSR